MGGPKMAFWQENYQFIKEIYEMRHTKMAEWMENVEKAIARIMADKVYTSAEFKRERDNFQALCKDLERTEVKKWLNQILEILMAERAKSQQETENEKLNVLIKKHEELIPSVQKTSVMVDLYWKCYAYGDELIERQEKSLVQLDSKKNVVVDLIAKGKVILEHPDKPKLLEGNVKRIQEGWDDTKKKAQDRLKLLQDTKEAWVGYADNNETIAQQFEVAEEEIKMVKKRYNLDDALADLKKRQDLHNKSNNTINGLFKDINDNFTCMSITLPEDKKKIVDKEIKAVDAKLEVVTRFRDTVKVIEDFCAALVNFDTSLNSWVAKDKSSEGENQFSLEKMESTLGELKNIFKEKEKLVEGL